MISWIIQMAIISIVFIFLVHHLLSFFKTTLTVPKVKDLVNSPSQKYQHIFDTLSQKPSKPRNESYTNIDDLVTETETPTPSSMKNELKHFLKKQLNSDDNSSMNVMGFDSYDTIF
jgi:hypothetical protein